MEEEYEEYEYEWDDPEYDEVDVMRKKEEEVTIGADPEFFLKARNGRNISAHGIVPGTKAQPHKLTNGAVQLDGTAVEFNIAPAKTAEEFTKNIETTLKEIRGIVPERYNFNFTPAVFYNKKYFDEKIPEDSKMLGCDPDYDAYAWGKPNERPDNNSTMRTGAGHLHIGWGEKFDTKDNNHILDCCIVARQLDAIFKLIERNWDTDEDRRKMYGKFGAFRPKPYGMEYRSLSNAWVKYPKLWPVLFNICKQVYTKSKRGYDFNKWFNVGETMSPKVWNAYLNAMGVLTQDCRIPVDFKEEVINIHA